MVIRSTMTGRNQMSAKYNNKIWMTTFFDDVQQVFVINNFEYVFDILSRKSLDEK